jgi:signal transduction histidine kinase
VLLVLFAAGISAVVMLLQLRAFQASFDRLTKVYVVFNHRLTKAHVQAVRVHEHVRSHPKAEDADAPERPDPATLANFQAALYARDAQIAKAREPIDDALQHPDRFGGALELVEVQKIAASLDELEGLTAADAVIDPVEVLETNAATHRQAEIVKLFNSLAEQSRDAIEDLGDEVGAAQDLTFGLTLGLTLGATVLGALAAIGVFWTLRPLRQLTQSVRDLGRGDWTQRVHIAGSRGDDEVGQLAAEFNMMAGALEERERRLLRGERLAAAGQLAAQITHEIRNPLSSVALNVELLEDELNEASPEGRHLLAQINKEIDRLTAVTEDYLGFARRPKPELSPLDLREELRSLLEFISPELHNAGVELEVKFPDAPSWVMGDSNQLRQAFMNLIRNAQEAALEDETQRDSTARIGIEMECKDAQVSVVVSDNGPGIDLPPEQLDRIFEAFYTRKARGTGLGLPTVQQILVDHGGSVRVAKTGAEGTFFEVQVPACDSRGSKVGSPPLTAASPQSSDKLPSATA